MKIPLYNIYQLAVQYNALHYSQTQDNTIETCSNLLECAYQWKKLGLMR